VIIARAGQPVVGAHTLQGGGLRRRRLGLVAGQAELHADFDELPADIAAAFGADEL